MPIVFFFFVIAVGALLLPALVHILEPLFKFGLLAALLIGGVALAFYLFKHLDNEINKARMATDERKLRNAETIRLYELANRPIPSPDEFLQQFAPLFGDALARENLKPPEDLIRRMLFVAKILYENDVPDPIIMELPRHWLTARPNFVSTEAELGFQLAHKERAQYAENFDIDIVNQTLCRALLTFVRALPPVRHTQFSAPVSQFISVAQVVTDIAMAFYHTPGLRDRNLFESVRRHYESGSIRAMEEQIKVKRDKKPVYPRQYQGSDIASHYLPPPLSILFDAHVPFGLSDETRTMGNWVLGDWGRGKTTYLSHLVEYDLARAALNQCSVVLIDSTRTMVHSLARSKWFAPGGPLDGRLILIGPEDPIQLNLFADKHDIDASVDMISYAIAGNIHGGSDSIFQSGAARYITRVIIEHGGNLLDFDKILQPKGHLAYADAIARCPQNVQDYFRTTFAGLRDQSRQSLLEKIAFVREKRVLEDMFTAEGCKLDLFTELQRPGKVVLVDTDKNDLKTEGSTILGRFIIALLNRVVQQRARYPEASLNHVFCYIDEAQNYISADRRFAEMLTDARKRRINLTVAHHFPEQIADIDVRRGLGMFAIQTECVKRGLVNITFRTGATEGAHVYQIPITKLRFDELPPMSPADYALVRAANRQKYGTLPRSAPPRPTQHASADEAATEF